MNAAMEEYDYMRDTKYRMYVAAVDKALKNFDYTSEWADLISALGKLNKVLSSYTRYPVIPRRIKISKRLAQCMHPALPSGVHLKALETYDIIFRSMGTQRLANELFIYSAGLFPLMGHAAMNIRPTLLTIYETHFVPLGDRLRPALSGFLSGILPGLDTGSDHFERTNNLLEAVCKEVDPAYFYTCVWQCVANNSPVRLPAITYVLSHYSKKYPMEDQLYLMGLDIGLMVNGLCAAVQDSSVLVQRSALDLLMSCLPMQNKQLLYADMVKLVTAALSTILRRDMSLNRRLYSWLLENEVNNIPIVQIEDTNLDKQSLHTTSKPHTIAYDLLNDALKIILKKCCTEVPLDIKPYRLLTSLFDKPQIGPVILDSILYEVFRTLYLSCLHQQKHKNSVVRCVQFNGDITSLKSAEENTINRQFLTKNCQELVKNANLLFNTLQSYYIWSYIEKVYAEAVRDVKNCKSRDRCQVNEIGSGVPHILEICILTDFLLDIIPIESYAESTSNILPNLFNKIISTLRQNINIVNQHEIRQSLELCTKILTKIQPITITTQVVKPDDDLSLENTINVDSIGDKSVESVAVKESETEPNRTLEKSKSDSKINENLDKNELTIEESSRERSYSNQMLKKKEKSSPRSDKKPKNKKSKSSSKLYDIKRDESRDEMQEAPIQEKAPEKPVEKESAPILEVKTAKLENKYFLSCLEEYKKFYVVFIKSKILPNVDINSAFAGLICDKNGRTKRLEELLKKRLEKASCEKTNMDPAFQGIFPIPSAAVNAAHEKSRFSEYEAAMNAASNILLEFSAFPNVNVNSIDNGCDSNSNVRLPDWLVVLIVAACCKESTRDVQIAAMSTLLEIFSLAANNSQIVQGKEAANTNIVISGILEQSCVNYVEENTIVIEEISQILWRLLGILNNQKQLMLCVTLLYQIHNIFDMKPFVEHVISIYLSDDYIQLDYIKQFFLLWHLGRDLSIKLPSSKCNIKNFDRSLLKILDNLQNQQKPTFKLLAESFLSHSLYHNDIPRIINPILSKLLAPSTARLSIKHVNIQDADGQSDSLPDNTNAEEIAAKKICAVSNHNGNIMYHVMDSNPKPSSTSSGKKKWFAFAGGGSANKSDKKYQSSVINTMTSLMDDNAIVTKKNKDFKNISISPRLDKASKGLVKLIVNPLGAKEVYPNGAEGFYNKLDSHSSSDEDLSSSNDNTITSTDDSYTKTYPNYEAADSGFDSMRNRSHLELRSLFTHNMKLIESLEPVSDGIKNELPKISKSHSFDEKIASTKADENSLHSAVKSWSYCMSDSANLNVELEFSKSAEEFFQPDNEKSPVQDAVRDILNDILNNVCAKVDNPKSPERPTDLDLRPKVKNFAIHSIHSHICLYCEIFDSNQVLYALHTLKNCINCNPQLFIKCLATSGVQNLKNNDILTLLARHRKSLLGYGFGGELSYEYLNFYRGYMFLDVIVSICLNYARTFYPFCDAPAFADEIANNLKIQLESLEVLDVIIKNLRQLVSENHSKGFANYIADLLVKCKLQNVLLHCLLISVRDFDEEMSFAEEILLFNHFQLCKSKSRMSEHVEAFQIQILRLIHSLIILEHSVFSSTNSGDQTQTEEYLSYTLIPNQNIFLSAILSALRNKCMRSMHEKWLNMITSCLPYFGDNLKQISISVIHQICNNIEDIASNYKKSEIADEFCSDYAVTQLEALTILCHYCLLDSSQTVNQNVPAATPTSTNPGEIFNNLVNVFFSPLTTEMGVSTKQNSDHYQNARKTILSHMPRIISSVAKLWQTVVNLESDDSAVFGSTKVVKQQLLEFLSPISVHHGGSFLAAVAVAWYERRNLFANVKTVLPEPNAGQNNLVYLISAIRVIPLDNLVQTVTAVIKNPPPIEGLTADICLDVSILELFYSYMRNASATQLSEAWSSLLALIRESGSLSPPAQFLLASLLYELMVKCCPLEERKDQKDLQDVTAKLIESVSQVCGSCLEQTTWLRRNLAVKEQEGDATPDSSIISTPNDLFSNSNHSVHAQLVLAEILAPMLDICFGSSEKDKVNTILSSLMYNIVPYLKTHTTKNMPSFNACSKLLSSLSSYQYTRKAWKKDVFDLLLDNAFFQMDYSSLKYWKVIVDNLMTHDNTTFRDLMNRVSMTQSGSLNIFSSKELEYEQKAQLLKRLAYVIFCSEMDQYAKYMPDIQEQLTSSLRLSVPGIQAQVFLCFRVILLRMSPLHVTSLWPIIISEMLQVFMQIEQQLLTDTDEFSSHIKLMSTLDASWAINSNNGLHALGHPHWLRLQLATAKLLDLVLLLPATSLPQFQMYRWAFVGDDLHHKSSPNESTFIPHVIRIAELMDCRFVDAPIETLPMKSNELLLIDNNIKQLRDLHGFFKTLSLCSNRHRTECSRSVSNDYNFNERQSDKKMDLVLEKIDRVVESDFLDKIPR